MCLFIPKHPVPLLLLVFSNIVYKYRPNRMNKTLQNGWACLVVAAQLCVSVAPSLINPWHLSQFNMDNPLHLLSRSLFPPPQSPPSLYRPSHSPVTHESLPDLCLSEEHPSTWRWEKSGVGLPDKTNEHIQTHTTTHTHTHKYTHQFPLHGPERVIEGEGLVALILLGLLVSYSLFPVGTCKHTQLSCINVCM